jgi:tRNA-2-methylthio-N6-dimethylallyladenosine synthase
MRSYFIETWGCQMNHHDSEHLEGQLRAHGLAPAPDPLSADLVLLNTCSVREKPVQKIISRIGVLSKAARPPRIGVCGCVAQQEGRALIRRSPSVAFVLGPGHIGRVRDALRDLEAGRRPVYTGFDGTEAETDRQPIFRTSRTRGMVTVIEGCNEFCTFCIVPYTRGRETSRPRRQVLQEVIELRDRGLREVELLGQTINAYRCPETGADFAELLDAVAGLSGLDRVRYITSHPRHFSDRLIRVIASHRNLSRYLHLPFQAGSDRILKRMNRKYTRQQYIDLITEVRDAVPDVNLSTDVIVGFPGETELDFGQSLALIEEVRFGQVFGFGFSPRPNTPAARYPDRVPDEVARERLHRLFELTDGIALDLNERLVGTTVKVLIDGESRLSDLDWQGRGEDNRVVNFPKDGITQIGDIVDIRIVGAGHHSLYGELSGRDLRLPIVRPPAPPP